MPTRCTRCAIRWPQDAGLCRTCQRELGTIRPIAEAERDRVARMHAKAERLPRAHYLEPERRTLLVGHREYSIVWDGSVQRGVPEPSTGRLCACGCGAGLSREKLRYASQGCAGRANKGLPTSERGRGLGGGTDLERPAPAQSGAAGGD